MAVSFLCFFIFLALPIRSPSPGCLVQCLWEVDWAGRVLRKTEAASLPQLLD